MSSLSSEEDFFPAFGLIFSPSKLSLALESVVDASSGTAPGDDEFFVSLSFVSSFSTSCSESFLGDSSTGLLGSATTVDGSAVSKALNST